MIPVHRPTRRCVCLLFASALAASSLQVGALAVSSPTQSVSMNVTLIPERLGHGTSIDLAVKISARGGAVPAPLTQLRALYPADFGIAVSGLGIETCTRARLQSSGPAGCPRDSVMGLGQAQGEIASPAQITRVQARLTVLRAENTHGHIALLFDAQGLSATVPNVVFLGLVLPARRPFDEIHIDAPLVPSAAGGSDVALVGLTATLGPAAGLRYTETAHGRTVPYRPNGILVPERCPRGGFPFAAALTFVGGSHASTQTRVRCPSKDGARRHSSEGS
jgi:hypothetical protein